MRNDCSEIVVTAKVDQSELDNAIKKVDELTKKIKEVKALAKDLTPLLTNLELKVDVEC